SDIIVREQDPIVKVELSSDGSLLATACRNGRVSIWDIKARKRLLSYGGDAKRINAIAMSPKLPLVSLAEGKSIVIMNIESGKTADIRAGVLQT
ncbi:MAG TPA: hypothetical protein VMB21_21945, partial [Candidatus Limnocylindria bacterium]|nr:hypothetical protein [Candidatus Limnocylindria bacterium]